MAQGHISIRASAELEAKMLSSSAPSKNATAQSGPRATAPVTTTDSSRITEIPCRTNHFASSSTRRLVRLTRVIEGHTRRVIARLTGSESRNTETRRQPFPFRGNEKSSPAKLTVAIVPLDGVEISAKRTTTGRESTGMSTPAVLSTGDETRTSPTKTAKAMSRFIALHIPTPGRTAGYLNTASSWPKNLGGRSNLTRLSITSTANGTTIARRTSSCGRGPIPTASGSKTCSHGRRSLFLGTRSAGRA